MSNRINEIEINGVLYELEDKNAGSSKLVMYTLHLTAETEGQTNFNITLESFDKALDTVLVQSGRTMLSPDSDYTIEGKTLTLVEGVDLGRNIDIYVFKNIPLTEEVLYSGTVLEPGSIPLDRLEKDPATKDYVDQQIAQVTETGIPKLNVYPLSVTAETAGQTVFNITLDTFDINTDTVFVQSGRTMLAPTQDFNVVDKTVVLNEGVPVGRVITIYVFKNVPMGEDGSVSGSTIADGSIPLSKLGEEVATKDAFTEFLEGKTPMSGDLSVNTSSSPKIKAVQTTIGRELQMQVTSDGYVYLNNQKTGDESNNRTAVEIAPESGTLTNLLRLRHISEGSSNRYVVFGEHNKPTGEYLGNGSATERTVNIGGIGKMLAIVGNSALTIVVNGGGWAFKDGSFQFLSTISYSNGVLTLKTNDVRINNNGSGYACFNL